MYLCYGAGLDYVAVFQPTHVTDFLIGFESMLVRTVRLRCSSIIHLLVNAERQDQRQGVSQCGILNNEIVLVMVNVENPQEAQKTKRWTSFSVVSLLSWCVGFITCRTLIRLIKYSVFSK